MSNFLDLNTIRSSTRYVGVLDPKSLRMPKLIDYTTSISSTVTVPSGIQNGDALFCAAARRNSTTHSTPADWISLYSDDAYSDEWNDLYIRVVDGTEPASYTFPFNNYSSYVCWAVRNISPNVFANAWLKSTGYFPEVNAPKGGILFFIANDAASSVHVTSAYGVITVGYINNSNTGCYVGYKLIYTTDLFSQYRTSGSSTPSYNAMRSISFNGA